MAPVVVIGVKRLLQAGAVLLMLCSSQGWAVSLEKLVMPGPVSSAHAEIEGECAACHSPLEEVTQQALCTTCHEDVGADMAAGIGFHGRHPDVGAAECQSCHGEHEGRDAATLKFEMDSFDHGRTDFPLLWGHSGLACESCHQPDTAYREAPSACASCHSEEDPHEGRLGAQCADCHTERSWLQTSFNHGTTGFPLTGGHASAQCSSCHADALFESAGTQCSSCHDKDDPHDGTLGNQCQQCHDTSSWTADGGFNHALEAGFPLLGGHSLLACKDCHAPGVPASAAEPACASCHAKDDPHEGRNGTDCAGCHTVSSWKTVDFDHQGVSGFALLGSHQRLACTDCHAGELTDPLPTTCATCHEDDPHEGQLGDRCESCHNNDSWVNELRFDHSLSPFPLLGKHATLLCKDCHLTGRFHDVEGDCASCHADDDVHDGAFGGNCEGCHQPGGWEVSQFDHEQHSGFALLGSHQDLSCQSCHGQPRLMEARSAQDCATCHRADDPHAGHFGSDCARCHSTDAFTPVRGY
jgi:hypothetical protein